jgi:UDP-N-acetylglucosamine 2-epimerase
MKLVTIIGNRPQAIKADNRLKQVLVWTGQHYDKNMKDIFFKGLKIKPKYDLNCTELGEMITKCKEVLRKEKATHVLVYGDTNSTIAGSLAAAKIHIQVIHVEAGLRSFFKAMPEEINRISCDHMSTILFTPTATGLENLKNEAIRKRNRKR